MGADFVFSVCEWPYDAEGKGITGSAELVEKVKERFTTEFNKRSEALEDWGIYIEPEDTEHKALILGDFYKKIESQFGGGWVRDVSDLNLAGRDYIITGGMSWGDDPNDSYAFIDILNDWGITREPF